MNTQTTIFLSYSIHQAMLGWIPAFAGMTNFWTSRLSLMPMRLREDWLRVELIAEIVKLQREIEILVA